MVRDWEEEHVYNVTPEDDLTRTLMFQSGDGWLRQWNSLSNRQQQAILHPDQRAATSTCNALIRRGYRDPDGNLTVKSETMSWYVRRVMPRQEKLAAERKGRR